MADRVYPSAKPATNGTTTATANGGANPTFPATKGQLYNTTRPVYRPQPPSRRHRRSCCCSCCLWTTFIIITIIFLAAVAGAIFWVLYRPHRPSFSVSSLQLSQFNLTSTQLTSRLNLTVTARNPNKKITFFYEPISVSVLSSDVDIGDGSFPGFEHGTKNSTTLRTVISNAGQTPDSSSISTLRSNLRNKNTLPLTIKLETKVKVKIGGLKTKRVGIRVACDGVHVDIPTGRAASTATTSNVKCKVDLRIKIWKWTV